MSDDLPIRDAATLVLLRDPATTPKVLMGQRGTGAAFMPNKFVFPGGRVDDADREGDAGFLDPGDMVRLASDSAVPPQALATAAVRELREETGLTLVGAALRFFLRAITPPGRPRRFDARFFLCAADGIAGDPDDFSQADGELRHLGWIGLDAARDLDLPFVTKVALAELAEIVVDPTAARPVPFLDNRSAVSRFRAL
ncbi:MAG: NUDIX hydrolase [Pseudomonadota bacterium]